MTSQSRTSALDSTHSQKRSRRSSSDSGKTFGARSNAAFDKLVRERRENTRRPHKNETVFVWTGEVHPAPPACGRVKVSFYTSPAGPTKYFFPVAAVRPSQLCEATGGRRSDPFGGDLLFARPCRLARHCGGT